MSVRGGSISEVGIHTLSVVDRSCDCKEFEEFFHDQFDQFFARSETRQQALHFVQSLLLNSERKPRGTTPLSANNKKISKAAQRLFFGAQWDDEAVYTRLQEFIVSELGHEKGICLIGVTYIPKKGAKTVGVQPQYNREISKEQNCQVCLFLAYTSPKGSTFLDRRLYLPIEWAEDRKRRLEAKIPENIEYRSKSDLTLDMLQSVHSIGAPIQWIVGGEPFCSDRALRNVIQTTGMNYILSGRNTESTFQPINSNQKPFQPNEGEIQSGHSAIYKTISSWPEKKWKRVIDNANGDEICVFDWASDRVLEHQNESSPHEVWLLARRPVSQRCETETFISNASQDATLVNLAKITSELEKLNRMVNEACSIFKMDNFGVRRWNSWHRHITLSMIAHAWWVFKGKRIIG
jgi:SRSO17 transposase